MYDIGLSHGNGSTGNQYFSIDNRQLKTNQVFTSEGNFSIRIRVADDENASLDKNFTIQAIHDPNKDDDNDGLTYAQEQALGTSDQNPDSDGDGFSDTVEQPMVPTRQVHLLCQRTPYHLNATSPLTILENHFWHYHNRVQCHRSDINASEFFLSGWEWFMATIYLVSILTVPFRRR